MAVKRTPLSERPWAAAWGMGLLALAIAAAWLPLVSGLFPHPTRVWRGYQVLLVRADAAASGDMADAAEALGPGVVTDLAAKISFWNFTGQGSVTIAGLDGRIDPRDPRYDSFMDGAAAYFHVPSAGKGEWRIAYVPARSPAVIVFLRLAFRLGLPLHGEWRLVEFDPLEALLSVAAFLAFALLQAFSAQKDRRTGLGLALVGTLLWLPFLLAGGTARPALGMVVLIAWYPLMEVLLVLRGWDEQALREARPQLGLFLGTAAAGFVLLLATGRAPASLLAGYLGPVLGSLLLFASLATIWGRVKRPRKRRRNFEPVPIVRPPVSLPSGKPAALGLALLALALLTCVSLARNAALPTPLPVPGARDFSWRSLARMGRDNRDAGLPNIADAVTHEAFQQTLSFGRPWGLPRSDERVYVREFIANPATGVLSARPRTVKVFDSTWLKGTLRRPEPGSLESLLLAQGRPVAVGLRGEARGALRDLPTVLLVAALFAAWLARDPATRPLMRGVLVRFNGVARRNQAP